MYNVDINFLPKMSSDLFCSAERAPNNPDSIKTARLYLTILRDCASWE